MADRRRIVTLDATGTATVLKDLEVLGDIQAVRDSFQITPPARKPVIASRARRYAGGRTVFETHDNGAVTFTEQVTGASVDNCIAKVSQILQVLESPRQDLYFEWRPDGGTTSTFYEVRGPATWRFIQSWPALTNAFMCDIEITIPVAPLARLAPQTFAISSTALPAVKALTGIGGDAPALANVSLRTSGGTNPPVFALFGWAKHPTVTPLSGSVAPFGIIEAETGTGLSGFAPTSNALYRGGSALTVTAAGAGSASASYVIDPSVLDPDDFAHGEVDIETWARLNVPTTLVSPRITLSLTPDAGTSFGQTTYTAEFGSTGKALVANGIRTHRLGVITMPVDLAQPVKWRLKIDATWAAGSTGALLMDYLVPVPARSRACSKTGVANDAAYAKFIASTADTTKTIRGQDLSGLVGAAAGNQARDSGLGGSLIELPPGDVDMVLKLSSFVPDDPIVAAANEELAHTCTGTITVIPRVFLAK